jgi:hypothetical protein
MMKFRDHIAVLGIALSALILAASANAAVPDLLSRELCKQTVPQVRQAYAGIFAPSARADYCIAGDFNGDGKPDVLMVVKVLVDKVPATAGVKTLHTFWDLEGKGRMQFLALHSTPANGMPSLAQYDKLLLDGGSPILVLRRDDIDADLLRVTPRSREVKGLAVPRGAMRGEGVYLTTEAVHAIVYWDGKRYVFHEDPAGP